MSCHIMLCYAMLCYVLYVSSYVSVYVCMYIYIVLYSHLVVEYGNCNQKNERLSKNDYRHISMEQTLVPQ